MEKDGNSAPNLREHDSIALSTANNSVSQQNQQSVSFPTSSTQKPKDATLKPKNEILTGMDKRHVTASIDELYTQFEGLSVMARNLKSENEELRMKQIINDEKDKRLGLYEELISELRDKCSVKEKQLTEKDEKLGERARLIEILEAKCAENESHLQSKINEFQAKCDKKEEQLIKKDNLLAGNKNLIEKLQAESAEKVVQLQSKADENDKLQAACNSKDAQFDEKTKLIEKLQADCTEKDTQMTANLDRLKEFEKSMHDCSKLVDTLSKCGFKCWDQKQYTEALAHYDNAIELEKATQNRSSKLTQLFSNKTICHHHLKQYQQAIDAANLALQFDSNNKDALNNRGWGYFSLKQYSNARQDYEKALQLDPKFELARDNLKEVQELINATSSQ